MILPVISIGLLLLAMAFETLSTRNWLLFGASSIHRLGMAAIHILCLFLRLDMRLRRSLVFMLGLDAIIECGLVFFIWLETFLIPIMLNLIVVTIVFHRNYVATAPSNRTSGVELRVLDREEDHDSDCTASAKDLV
ncbi:hypothetical protein F5Y15DRAFT_45394 [Xylariaceae sp. FL0016]|nr:hypothetical protein F5Y15DRAFT_45394 [Xylariaceae sp. FL0016]